MTKTIGFVSFSDPFNDKRNWSGTTYKLREAIENAGYKVKWIPYQNDGKGLSFKIKNKMFRTYTKYSKKEIIGGTHIPHITHKYASDINSKDMLSDVDLLFFPGGAQICNWLKGGKPYIYFSDANYHQMENYYWKSLDPIFRHKARKMEEKAVKGALLNIRSSRWATQSTIDDCGANPEQCHTICFGANIDVPEGKCVNAPINGETLNIVFSGVEWERKGGDIAVETVRILNKRGIKSKLFIVGIRELPGHVCQDETIECVGFLDKNNPQEYKKYVDLLTSMHVMILPTKAECAGIVFSEAALLGIPVFTFNTGGTSDYVIDGKNGYAIPLGSSPELFAELIAAAASPQRWNELHEGALELYRTTLSWDNWSQRFREIVG